MLGFVCGDNYNGATRLTLDIPTVALEHPHDTDRCKTDTVREDKESEEAPKKKRKIKVSADLKREWWETWADEEAGKFTGPYDL